MEIKILSPSYLIDAIGTDTLGLKIGDPRYTEGLRETYQCQPTSPQRETAFQKFFDHIDVESVLQSIPTDIAEILEERRHGAQKDNVFPSWFEEKLQDPQRTTQNDLTLWPKDGSSLTTVQEDLVLLQLLRDRIRTEEAAYRRLSSIWGEYIPQFIGRVSIADVHKSLRHEGLLLELVQGCTMTEFAKNADFKNTDLQRLEDQWLYLVTETIKIANIIYYLGVIHEDLSPHNIIINTHRLNKTSITVIDLARYKLFSPEDTKSGLYSLAAQEYDFISEMKGLLRSARAPIALIQHLDHAASGGTPQLASDNNNLIWKALMRRLWNTTIIQNSMIIDLDVHYDISRAMFQILQEDVNPDDGTIAATTFENLIQTFQDFLDSIIDPNYPALVIGKPFSGRD